MEPSNVIRVAELFDADNICPDCDIDSRLASNECFLAKKVKLKPFAAIDRDGDILYGIQNNESCAVKVTIYYNIYMPTNNRYNESSHIYDIFTIDSRETHTLTCPILLVKLYKRNPFTYVVEKLPTDGPGPSYLSMIYDYVFRQSIVNLEFVYGYLTDELRRTISLGDCYVNETRHEPPSEVCRGMGYYLPFCIGPYLYHSSNGTVYDDHGKYLYMNAHLIGPEYHDCFFGNRTRDEFKNTLFMAITAGSSGGWIQVI
jgi:hypothetical protein